MTDYEKLKNVFDELGIEYGEDIYSQSKDIFIEVFGTMVHFEFNLKTNNYIATDIY